MPKHELRLDRITDNGKTAIGRLYLNGKFLAHTLEDTRRFYEYDRSHPEYSPKVYGETCIAAGRYGLKDRRHGGFYARYVKKFASIRHEGMIELVGVPQFGDVLIHCGNTHKDSHGCILLGRQINGDFVTASVATYRRVYQVIYPLVKAGTVDLVINDVPRGGGGGW